MKTSVWLAVPVLIALAAGTGVAAQARKARPAARQPMPLVQVLPKELKFAAQPNGSLQATVVGDPTRPGLYAIRVRIPAGTRIAPHSHPDDRIVAVITGTLLVGFGEQVVDAQMKTMPPGSVFSEPAGTVHYTWAKDAGVVLHVTGVGPTGTIEVTK